MLIGNKLDLEEEGRVVTKIQAEEWCSANGNIDFLETSARNNKNIESRPKTLDHLYVLEDEKLRKS